MNKNSVAIISLCSSIIKSGAKPLSTEEYGDLAKALMEKGIQPEALLEYSSYDFCEILGVTEQYAIRLSNLINRSASLYFEISKYENMGISIVTRADSTYPKSLKKELGNLCPPLFYYAGDISIANRDNVTVIDTKTAVCLSDEGEAVKYASSLTKEIKFAGTIRLIQKRRLLVLSQSI